MMRTTHLILLAVIAAGCSGGQADTEKNGKKNPDEAKSKNKEKVTGDLAKMQGTWYNHNTPKKKEGINGKGDKVVISGNTIEIHSRYPIKMSITAIDNNKRWIDFFSKGDVLTENYFGVYSIEKGRLKIAYNGFKRPPHIYPLPRTALYLDLHKEP